MIKRALLILAVATADLIHANLTSSAGGDLYPNIVDSSHASSLVTEFFQGYFTAKSLHHADQWLQFFHPTQVVYYDATLGEGFPSRSALVTEFTE